MQEKQWVSVEGLIGAGKSTFIEKMMPYLEQHFGAGGVAVVKEPVDKWGSLLEKFASDPIRYGYLFQTYAFHTRQAEFNRVFFDNPNATVFISERSPWSDKDVFWQANAELNNMDQDEYKAYGELWETWYKLYPIQLEKIVYLKLDPTACENRIAERGRKGEVGFITRQYQELLRQKHVQLFDSLSAPILELKSDQNYRDDPEIARQYASRLIKFLDK